MAGVVTQKDNVRLYIWKANEEVKAKDKVGNITQIGDVGGETEDIDVTTIESTDREYENGFNDNGSVEITQNLTLDEYTIMTSRRDSGENLKWGIVAYNKAGNKVVGIQGQGIIKSSKLTGISVGGLLQAVSSLRINGAITSDFEDPGIIPGIVYVTGISIASAGDARRVVTDETLQFTATVEPDNATIKAVEWYVDNEVYATIDENGLLTAKSPGTVEVVANATDGSGKVSDPITITIAES